MGTVCDLVRNYELLKKDRVVWSCSEMCIMTHKSRSPHSVSDSRRCQSLYIKLFTLGHAVTECPTSTAKLLRHGVSYSHCQAAMKRSILQPLPSCYDTECPTATTKLLWHGVSYSHCQAAMTRTSTQTSVWLDKQFVFLPWFLASFRIAPISNVLVTVNNININSLNAELNPICHLLVLLEI